MICKLNRTRVYQFCLVMAVKSIHGSDNLENILAKREVEIDHGLGDVLHPYFSDLK